MTALNRKAEEKYPGKTKKAGPHGVLVRKQREAFKAGYAARDGVTSEVGHKTQIGLMKPINITITNTNQR